MGISNVMVHWFERLHFKNAFVSARSILELGPQDLVLSKAVLMNFAASVARQPAAPADIDRKFFAGDQPRWWTATRDFYALLGLETYRSTDIDDQRSDYVIDLNRPAMLGERFDVITNFGTAEHVFNIANVFKFIHDHLTVGGVALHVLPTRGQYNHGFYSINSTFYRDLAAANGYEIVDLVAVPDFGGQHAIVQRDEKLGDSPPRLSTFVDISADDDRSREQAFARTVLDRAGGGAEVFDYVFAALRRTSAAEFAYPLQTIRREDAPGQVPSRPSVIVEAGGVDRRAAAMTDTAVAYTMAERWAEAFDLLNQLCEQSPGNAEALVNLGVVARHLGKMDEALSAFRRAVATRPSLAEAHFQLAVTLAQSGNPAAASTVLRRVLALEPNHPGARAALAAIPSAAASRVN